MKKILSVFLAVCMLFCVVACNEQDSTSSTSNEESVSAISEISTETSTNANASAETSINNDKVFPTQPAINNTLPTIFLAGDSTVKTYAENTYIGGWGQYLWSYLNTSSINVVNASDGGRSSRSFINEGRLYQVEGGIKNSVAIGNTIKAGDYIFIQFGHNDDETNGISNLVERQVPLGTPDPVTGIYPTTPGVETATDTVPEAFTSSVAASETANAQALAKIKTYGNTYYAYDSGGTYKWFLKQYIDYARSKDATPVLVTPVTRTNFDANGKILDGNGRFGADFAYIKAVRQLAEEENCLLIDLFAETVKIAESLGANETPYLMALKPTGTTGSWPSGYESKFASLDKEKTHYNKYGAFITAAKVAEILKGFVDNNTTKKDGEKISFGAAIKTTPVDYIVPTTMLSADGIAKIKTFFTTMKISAD